MVRMLEISIKEKGTLTIIALNGRLDVSSADSVRQQICGLMESSHRSLIICMADCEYVSSLGIRALLVIAKLAKNKAIKLVFAALKDEVYDVFEMTGFLTMLICVPTIQEAEQMFD